MHFMGLDQRHGYQKRLVGDITGCYPGGPSTEFGPALDGSIGVGMSLLRTAGVRDTPVLRYDEAVTRGCEDFLAARSSDRRSQPLFMTVGLFGPHNPYCCPQDLYDYACEQMKAHGDRPLPLEPDTHPCWLRNPLSYTAYRSATAEQVRRVRAAYAGAIGVIDRHLGRVIKAAESLPGETIIIYTSDHGEAAGDREMFIKCTFYDNAEKVPMLWMRLGDRGGEGHDAKGARVDANVSLMDLPSTLAEITGAPCPPRQQGASINSLLQEPRLGEQQSWKERPVFADLSIHYQGETMTPPMRMIRKGRYKLNIFHSYPVPQLFDMEADPHETRDLALDPAYASLIPELRDAAIEGWDPIMLAEDAITKDEDLTYMRQWGADIGMGPLDLWDQ
jgi:choline-sulfatase